MANQQLSTNTFGCAKWIVSSDPTQGTHTTIAAALTTAVLGDTICIRPGTYTENITLKAGVNLTAFGSDGISACQGASPVVNVIILGTTTATFTGNVTLSGIQLKTNGATSLSMTGSNATGLTLINCSIYASNATGFTLNNSSSSLNFYMCTFRSDSTVALYTATATGGIDFEQCTFLLSATATNSTIALGRAVYQACDMPGMAITTSSTGGIFVLGCSWQFGGTTLLTTAGTGTSEVYNSWLSSTTASTISVGSGTTVNIGNCTVVSSNTNAITGAGTLNYGNVTFGGSSNTINTTTKNPLISRPSFRSVAQVFTSNGTYTPTPGMVSCKIECLGGGGGGGGAQATGVGTVSTGGGGGGGEYAQGTFSAATIGVSQSVTIGAAGAANSGATGGNGGNTSVGALISTNGGSGGPTAAAGANNNAQGGSGGSGGSGGDFRTRGQPGFPTACFLTPGSINSGTGASSQYGSGGLAVINSATAGNAASGYGAGGSGGANYTSASAVAGGAGVTGIVIVTEYVLS